MIADYRNMMGNARFGKTLNGQQIPTYNAGKTFQYNTPNVSYAPQRAYRDSLNNALDGVAQDQHRAMAQASRGASSRGIGRVGLHEGNNTSLAREAMGRSAQLRSNFGMQQARDQIDIDKFSAGQDLQRQGMQASENLSRAGQSLNAQQVLQNILNSQINTVGSLYDRTTQEEMRPYQMMSDLYGKNLQAEAAQSSQGGKGDPFSALLNAGAQGAMAYGTKGAGPAASTIFPKAAGMASGIINSVL